MDKNFRINRECTGAVLLVAAVIIAVAVRTMRFYEVSSTPQFQVPVLDAGFSHVWAKSLVSADFENESGQRIEGINESAYFRPPGYSWFLALLYKVWGSSPGVAVVAQLLLGVGVVLLIYALGSGVDSVAGGAGALLYALYWPALCYETALLDTALCAGLLLLLAYILCLWSRRSKPVLLLFAGFVLGICALVRPNILLFAPCAAALVFISSFRKRGFWLAVKSVAVLTIAALLIVLPVTLRNWRVAREFVLISSNGGINFYIGNGAKADGVFVKDLGEFGVYSRTDDNTELLREVARLGGDSVTDREVGAILFKRALADIMESPVRWFRLLAVKAGYIFGEPGVRLNIDAHQQRQASRLLRCLPLRYSALVALGLAGLAVMIYRNDARTCGIVIAVLLGCWYLSLLLFFVTDQYRQITAPLCAVGGGIALSYMLRWLREKRWFPLAVCGVSVIPLLLLTGRNWNSYRADRTFESYNNAMALRQSGELEKARTAYLEITRLPVELRLSGGRAINGKEREGVAKAANQLGLMASRQKNWADAAEFYELSLAYIPDYKVKCNYAVCLMALTRYAEAVVIFEQLLRENKDDQQMRVFYEQALKCL